MTTNSGIDDCKRANTPAGDNLFEVREDSEAGELTQQQKEWFHSYVAKCLYLSKRSRPDILTAVSFLTTRVTKCNLDDMKKLLRLLYYLSGTVNRGIVLRIGDVGVQVRQYVDAAYGVFSDMKSSSGGVTVIGDRGPVEASSCKQTIVAKSSMEAELVAASDLLNEALHLQKLLEAQGYEKRPVILYQDNQSCMHTIASGKAGSKRTRHIDIRYFWIKQYVDNGEVLVMKLATEEMPANMLTKSLQGAQFKYERGLLTNWEE